MQLFADDTSALINQEDRYLEAFWDYLNIYFTSVGSIINHQKIGIKSYNQITPQWLRDKGCEVILEGIVFRLVGIPMVTL